MKNVLNKNLDLKGKKVLLRVDLNVPMKNGAITETSRIEKIIPTINLLLEKQAKIIIISHIGRPKGKVVDITEEKLVSIDFNHNSFSAIVDASLTCVVGKNMGKISAWYDNEWGFSNRMCDLVKYIHKI